MQFFVQKKSIIFLAFFSFCCILANQLTTQATNQFVVVKQKKRGPTRSRLQESSCQHMSAVLQRLSCFLRHIATVQDCCLKQVADFLEGASDSVLISVDKEKLKKIESALKELDQYLESVDGEITKKMNALNLLLKK